jgi:hypothetical protein
MLLAALEAKKQGGFQVGANKHPLDVDIVHH